MQLPPALVASASSDSSPPPPPTPPLPPPQADDQLRRWYDDNVVDQKLAEEEIRVELASLAETVGAHKALLEEELVDKVGISSDKGHPSPVPSLVPLVSPLVCPLSTCPHKVGAVRADVDKLKLRFKAERKEREALTELAAVHSEVFVDVQRKLEGHGQKLRTHEVQMTAMADESSEKFIALEVDLAATKKETKKVGQFYPQR